MIDANIILALFAVGVYVMMGVIFQFKWFYYLSVLTGYLTGLTAGTVGILLLLV